MGWTSTGDPYAHVGDSALDFDSEEAAKEFAERRDYSACIRCGRCVKNCPMQLMPLYLAQYAKAKRYDEAAKLNVMSCVECGTCSYNCPGNVEIVQYCQIHK